MRLAARSFAANGHALFPKLVSARTCGQLRSQALRLLDASAFGLAYTWARFALPGSALLGTAQLEPVRSPFRRHCVTLPASEALDAATAQLANAALAVGLPPSARMLEQDATIVLPGAFAQGVHTDISPSVPDTDGHAPLVTVWLALQAVTVGMGPTTVYPGSHLRYARRAALQEARIAQADAESYASYCADGTGTSRTTLVSMEDAGNVAARSVMGAEMDEAEAADIAREAGEFGPVIPEPIDLLLERGDAGIMDCRVRHFGSGYRYSWHGPARVLLNATFGLDSNIRGFTYHRHTDARPPTITELVELGRSDGR